MAAHAGLQLEIESTVPWGELSDLPSGGPHDVTTNGTHVLVRSFHLSGGVEQTHGLWDLSTLEKVRGAWMGLLPDGRHGLRRHPDGLEVAELGSGKALARIAYRSALSLCPDAPFATTWLLDRRRVDAPPSTLEWVFDLRTGERRHELKGPFVLGVFVPGGRLATFDRKGAVTVWDLATGARVAKGSSVATPLGVRLDRTRARMVVVGAGGAFVVLDTTTWATLFAGKSPILLGADSSFSDGRHVLHGGVILDVQAGRAKTRLRRWLKGKQTASSHFLPLAEPLVAVQTQRVFMGPDLVELWDTDREALLHSVEVPSRPVALAALPGDRVVVAHGPSAEDDDDDMSTSTALTILSLRRSAETPPKRPKAPVRAAPKVGAKKKAR